MTEFLVVCLSILVIVMVQKWFLTLGDYHGGYKRTCDHQWTITSVEYTESPMGITKYKVITKQCDICNDVDVDKYKIN